MLPGSDRGSCTGDEGVPLPERYNSTGTRIPDDSPRISEPESDQTPSEVSENVTSTKQTYSEEIKTVSQTNGLSADTIELPDNVPE
jgi:hypothetical protein